MKFLVAFVAVVAVAAAFRPMDSATAQLDAIIAAIASPNTDPATAAMLEHQLQEILATLPVVQPAIADPAVISPTKPFVASDHLSPEVLEIMQAIASPNTDPATAAALSEMLIQSLGLDIDFAPIDISPAIVDVIDVPVIAPVVKPVPVITPAVQPVPIISPAVKPVPVVTPPSALNPPTIPQPAVSPAGVVAPVETSAVDVSPLVQIILNINQASAATPAVSPVVTPAGVTEVVAPVAPVTVVDEVPVSPVVVVDPVSPVVVVDELPVAPVTVVDVVPVSPVVVVEPAVDPVSVADPILPVPAVIIPEILN